MSLRVQRPNTILRELQYRKSHGDFVYLLTDGDHVLHGYIVEVTGNHIVGERDGYEWIVRTDDVIAVSTHLMDDEAKKKVALNGNGDLVSSGYHDEVQEGKFR